MNDDLLPNLTRAMAEHGFRPVADPTAIPDARLLLKRQTWNTNRALVVVAPAVVPADFRDYLRQLRRHVAFRCGFAPVLWGLGLQVVVIAPGISASGLDPREHVPLVDNQWSIVQSIFLADSATRTHQSSQTWGQ